MPEMVNLLLLGTGTVGASIGLALRRSSDSFRRLAYDPDRQTLRAAAELDAFDQAVRRAADGAAEADLVVLCLEPIAARRALESLSGRLRPDVVILSTTPTQATLVEAWRAAFGPANPYLAAVPFVGPQRALATFETLAPSADLFAGGVLGIAAPPGTPEGAIDVALDLATILGVHPFFLDPAELDSAAATSDQLPMLLAAALLDSLSANPGWRDQRRLVGPRFAQLAALVEGLPSEAAAAEATANREHLISRLEALVSSLESIRAALAGGQPNTLEERLDSAADHYREWRSIRLEDRPDHGAELPGLPRLRLFDRLLGRRPRS